MISFPRGARARRGPIMPPAPGARNAIRRAAAWCGAFAAVSFTAARGAEDLVLMERILADPQREESAVRAGRKLATLCAPCHGIDGNSSYPWVPNLASQNPLYFLEQVERFRGQQRSDHVMSDVIALLDRRQWLDLGLYLRRQPIRPRFAVDVGRVAAGEETYRRHCLACHGAGGVGGAGRAYAWLAGQQPEYLVRSLKRFRDGSSLRRHPAMAAAAKPLSDDEIENVAAYLGSLR